MYTKCNELLDSDGRFMICNQNIHVFCSEIPTEDEKGVIVFPNYSHSHEAIGTDFEALVEEYLPSHSSKSFINVNQSNTFK